MGDRDRDARADHQLARYERTMALVAIVWAWPGLGHLGKVAWLRLWELAGHRADRVVINAAWLAALCGAKDAKTGRLVYGDLQRVGLLEEIANEDGRWTAYVPDPTTVAIARKMRGVPQLDFAWVDAVDGGQGQAAEDGTHAAVAPAEAPAKPPRPPRAIIGEESARANHQSSESSVLPMIPMSAQGAAGATAGAAVAGEQKKRVAGGVKKFGDVLGARLLELLEREPDEAGQVRRVEALVDEISRIVDDPGLRVKPILRVAQAVVDGRLPAESLQRVLGYLCKHRRRGTLREPPGCYFTRSMFKELGIAEGDGPATRSPAS